MKHEWNIWVVGGDQRQAQLAVQLARDGHTVHTYALERAGELGEGVEPERDLRGAVRADCVILPLPVTGEGTLLNTPLSEGSLPLAEVLDRLRPGQIVCAGLVTPPVAALADARGQRPRERSRSPWRSCPSPSTEPGCS